MRVCESLFMCVGGVSELVEISEVFLWDGWIEKDFFLVYLETMAREPLN